MTLLLEFWPYIAAAGAALLAFWRVYAMGQNSVKAKQAKKELAAAKDRLEMDREATVAERNAAGMTDAEARAEAEKWAKR
jgi:outer membrane murein-binding lipoprotein Lpp